MLPWAKALQQRRVERAHGDDPLARCLPHGVPRVNTTIGIGFAKGANSFEQGPTPNGTQVADGYYHPEDEVFMPWFMRLSPSTSQAVQTGTGGRYTLMGSLNPFPGFKMPATGC